MLIVGFIISLLILISHVHATDECLNGASIYV